MRANPRERRVLALLKSPRNTWALARFRAAELPELERIADGIAQQAAELGAYLAMRGGAGCGDHGHDKAMTHAAKRLRRVRKAMGYSQP